MLPLLLSVALADPTGFYDEGSVAAASAAFRRANAIADTMSDAQARVGGVAKALRDYEEALDAIGVGPGDDRDRLARLRRQFGREQALLQRHVDDLSVAFDDAFRASMERALATRPGEEARCEPPAGGIAGIVVRRAHDGVAGGSPSAGCVGDDLNAAIAAAMDQDATLDAELDALLARPWPAITVDTEAPSSTGGGVWIPFEVARPLAAGALDAVNAADDRARVDLEAAVEGGLAGQDVEALRATAAAIDAATAEARVAAFAGVRRAVERRAAKTWEWPMSWCANPTYLGGCMGEGVAPTDWEALAAHKSVVKASARVR